MAMKRGFACMTPEQRRAIASKGGKRAQEIGTAHRFDSEEGKEMGQRGGRAMVDKYGAVFMSTIGRMGGIAVGKNREHMVTIGRKGGRTRSERLAARRAANVIVEPVESIPVEPVSPVAGPGNQ